MKLLLAILLCLSCAKAPKADDSEPTTAPIKERFAAAEQRVLTQFLENGWLVSRGTNGEVAHQGDSLIFTGIWLGAASCAAGNASEAMLQDTIERNGGALVRYEPMDGNAASLDGALGLYSGIADRIARCPESLPRWRDVMLLHKQFVEDHSGHLHGDPGAGQLVPEFDYVLDLLLARLTDGPGSGFDGRRLSLLVAESTAWAVGVKAAHAAAFRIHISFLAFRTAEALGQAVNDVGRNGFCAATAGVDMPTVDHWCGRGDLVAWVDAFEPNKWEYRHQRSGSWETPDGQGFQTPGIDLLVGIRAAYTSEGLDFY